MSQHHVLRQWCLLHWTAALVQPWCPGWRTQMLWESVSMPPLSWDTLSPAALLQTTVPWIPCNAVRRILCMVWPRALSVRVHLVLHSILPQVVIPHIHNSASNELEIICFRALHIFIYIYAYSKWSILDTKTAQMYYNTFQFCIISQVFFQKIVLLYFSKRLSKYTDIVDGSANYKSSFDTLMHIHVVSHDRVTQVLNNV